MNYTYDNDQIVFLKDRDIVLSIDGTGAEDHAILSNGIVSFDLLSSEVNQLSTQDNRLSDYIRDNVEVSCSNLCAVVSSLINRDSKDVSFFGDVSLSSVYLDPDGEAITLNTLYGLVLTNQNFSKADDKFHPGFLFHVTSVDEQSLSDFTVKDNNENTLTLHSNDYLMITNDVNEIRFISVNDVIVFRDYAKAEYIIHQKIDTLSAYLSSDISTLSSLISADLSTAIEYQTNLSIDVTTLSIQLSTDITTLSSQVSTDITVLSANLSTDITTLSAQLSTDIDTISANLSTDIDTLSVNLSTDITTLSVSLSTDIDTLSTQLSTDITTLSAQLSTDIYTLSVNLSTDINILSIQLSTDVYSLSTHISADVDILSVNLSTDITTLSVSLSTDIDTLSTQLSTDVSVFSVDTTRKFKHLSDEIDTIYDDIRGGVVYKGHINLTDTGMYPENNLSVSEIFGIYYKQIDPNTRIWNDDLLSVRNGWLYNVSVAPGQVYRTLDNIEFENNDYIIIDRHVLHEQDITSVVETCISSLTRETIDIIEAVQDDYVRLKQLQKLSTDLSTDVTTLSVQLSTEIKTSTENLSVDVKTISAQLSTDVKTISANLSTDVKTISAELSADIKTLSTELSTDVKTLSIELSTDVYALSTQISSDISALSAQLSTDVKTISANLSVDVKTISAELSADIKTLSANLSTDITTLSSQLSTDIDTLSVNLSTDIDTLSTGLSTDVNAQFVHISGDSGIGDLVLTGSLSAKYVTAYDDNVQHFGVVGPSAMTFIDSSDREDPAEVYTYSYPRTNGTFALTHEISSLSTEVFEALSAKSESLSVEISSVVSVYDSEKNYVGNKLSAVKVSNAEYNALVTDGNIDDRCLYVITDDYIDARGQQIKNIASPSISSDAASKHYVDTISAEISADTLVLSNQLSTDIKTLSANLSTDITTLSTQLSTDVVSLSGILLKNNNDISTSLSATVSSFYALSGDVNSYEVDADERIETLSGDFWKLKSKHYDVTLSSIETDAAPHGEGIYPDNLVIVDHTHSEEQHKKYYLKFEFGSLALKAIDG